jgi:hypothetical protein
LNGNLGMFEHCLNLKVAFPTSSMVLCKKIAGLG